jgi:signal transduction histidine kinase
MTWLGALLPWFLFKRITQQTAASNSFEVGGENLNAIRINNAFYVISLPTRGLRAFLFFFAYFLPAGLVIRHRSRCDFTVEAGTSVEPRTCPVWQIDPNMALVEYFSPQELRVRQAEWARERTPYLAQRAIERAQEKAEKARWAAERKIYLATQRDAARRAAAVLRSAK